MHYLGNPLGSLSLSDSVSPALPCMIDDDKLPTELDVSDAAQVLKLALHLPVTIVNSDKDFHLWTSTLWKSHSIFGRSTTSSIQERKSLSLVFLQNLENQS